MSDSPVFSLDRIYRRHWTELCRYIEHTFGRGPPEPEDIAQEVFARFAARPDAHTIDNPGAFLFRSARNLVLDHYRKHKVRAQFAVEFTAGLGETVNETHGENVLSAREHLDVVEAVVRAMDEKRRTVFLLRHLEGLQVIDISRRLGIPEPSVRRYLAQAFVACAEAVRVADGERKPKLKLVSSS